MCCFMFQIVLVVHGFVIGLLVGLVEALHSCVYGRDMSRHDTDPPLPYKWTDFWH